MTYYSFEGTIESDKKMEEVLRRLEEALSHLAVSIRSIAMLSDRTK